MKRKRSGCISQLAKTLHNCAKGTMEKESKPQLQIQPPNGMSGFPGVLWNKAPRTSTQVEVEQRDLSNNQTALTDDKEVDKQKVEKANQLYDAVSIIALARSFFGCLHCNRESCRLPLLGDCTNEETASWVELEYCQLHNSAHGGRRDRLTSVWQSQSYVRLGSRRRRKKDADESWSESLVMVSSSHYPPWSRQGHSRLQGNSDCSNA